jgi:radical SAM superfamily enzyme YgiQ (UPF0313 family)
MTEKIDAVLINPGERKQIFQELGHDMAAIEPPFWITVMAAYLRNKGYNVRIIDSNAENLSPEETAQKVNEFDPKLAAVIIYGSHPSASTQNMTIAGAICRALKEKTDAKIAIGGLHPSALPRRTMEEKVDFVVEGEGPYTLKLLLEALSKNKNDYLKVLGLWYRDNGKIVHNPQAPLIQDLDEGLPIAAWDLLPMHTYRAHNWHCFDDIHNRAPYGTIYTSLGCPFSCVFCCINTPFGKPGIRYRSPELVIQEIDTLVKKYKVKNLKIVDELFVLSEPHYMRIVDLIIKNSYDLNIWAYARVDTIKYKNLKKMKKAGINWLALGIESASTVVRDGANKQMKAKDIIMVARRIQDEGIRVGANYIFGLPDDTVETMQETLDLAIKINAEYSNFYSAMAYPGSKLYNMALRDGKELPKTWLGYSQYSYECLPLSTEYVSATEILRFRDNAFHVYFKNPIYLSMIESKFGKATRGYVELMTKTNLKRKLFEA